MEEYKREFYIDDNGELIEGINIKKRINDYCYFCDFCEVKPHQHHIIRKCDGGKNVSNNIIPLCANHHELIHRRIYVLAFNSKKGFYYLVHRETRKYISPTERQKKYVRKLPLSSINNSSNLTIKGNLDKGVICIND
jgi:predicted restriction endonuclease